MLIGQWVASAFLHLVFDIVVKEGLCVCARMCVWVRNTVLLQVEIMILNCYGERRWVIFVSLPSWVAATVFTRYI